jgi:sister chromatid cohesion protein DCC1
MRLSHIVFLSEMICESTALRFKDSSSLSSDIKSKRLLLFEVPNSLAEQIENGYDGSFSLKGDEVVLTTKSNTYQIRHAETSNTFMLCDDADDFNTQKPSIAFQFKFGNTGPSKMTTIVDSGSTFFEVLPSKPRFDSVSSLLPVYSGRTSVNTNETIFTVKQLLEIVPCSEAQLLEYLYSIHVVELHGFLYRIDPQYVAHVLELLLLTVQEQGCISSSIIHSLEETDIEITILKHVFDFHTVADDEICTLNDAKASRSLGHALLLKQDRWELESFISEWRKACFDVEVQLSYLEGLYLLEEERPVTIMYFPKDSLSSDPKTRLQQLFKARSKWRKTDLLPFVQDLGEDKELNAIFLKYARESKTNNKIFLTSKYVIF